MRYSDGIAEINQAFTLYFDGCLSKQIPIGLELKEEHQNQRANQETKISKVTPKYLGKVILVNFHFICTYFDGCLTKQIPVGLNFKDGHSKLEYNIDPEPEEEIELFLVKIVKQLLSRQRINYLFL